MEFKLIVEILRHVLVSFQSRSKKIWIVVTLCTQWVTWTLSYCAANWKSWWSMPSPRSLKNEDQPQFRCLSQQYSRSLSSSLVFCLTYYLKYSWGGTHWSKCAHGDCSPKGAFVYLLEFDTSHHPYRDIFSAQAFSMHYFACIIRWLWTRSKFIVQSSSSRGVFNGNIPLRTWYFVGPLYTVIKGSSCKCSLPHPLLEHRSCTCT